MTFDPEEEARILNKGKKSHKKKEEQNPWILDNRPRSAAGSLDNSNNSSNNNAEDVYEDETFYVLSTSATSPFKWTLSSNESSNSKSASVKYSSKTGIVVVRGIQPLVVKKLAVIRAHPSVRAEDLLESFVDFERFCHRKPARILVRQHHHHPAKLVFSVVNGKRMQQAVSGMSKRGFSVAPTNLSSGVFRDGIFLKEGEIMSTVFGSNVRVKETASSGSLTASPTASPTASKTASSTNNDSTLKANEIAFFNNFDRSREFDLEIVDPFIQKEYSEYKVR